MKKKLLFTLHSMDIGGIETSLINILNNLDYSKYEVTIIFRNKEGRLLDLIPKQVRVIDYGYKTNGKILDKIKNRIRLFNWEIKYKNKFDFSACYAPYCYNSAYIARHASKNSYIWGHMDYMLFHNNNEKEVREFFENKSVEKFKNVIFVSKEGKASFDLVFPELKNKSDYCYNIMDKDKLQTKVNEKVEETKPDTTLFLNVSRHDERHKRISRIINAAKKLKEEGYKFQIWLIGEGPSTEEYKKMVKDYNLEQQIIFLGYKINPYPYVKMADATILASDLEGFPMSSVESVALNTPVITTNLGDAKYFIKEKYGIVVPISDEGVYKGMKEFLENGYNIKEKLDVNKYNKDIMDKLETLFNS